MLRSRGMSPGTFPLRVHQALPGALLITSPTDAINHCILTRAELRLRGE